MNEALRQALAAAGLSQLDVAARLTVDPKTVERWLAGRVPHPQSREAIAGLVGMTSAALWPDAEQPRKRGGFGGEVQSAYPHRWDVPREVWVRFFRGGRSEIDVLVYSGLFLVEDAGIMRLLSSKARAGVPIRLLFGDPDCAEVTQRGIDEQTDGTTSARIRNALALVRPLAATDGVTLRLHRTTLYNSIFRSDDSLLVNPHIFGMPGASAPVLHLKRSDESSMFSTYVESFERIWSGAYSDGAES